jgi:hypothetical protein
MEGPPCLNSESNGTRRPRQCVRSILSCDERSPPRKKYDLTDRYRFVTRTARNRGSSSCAQRHGWHTPPARCVFARAWSTLSNRNVKSASPALSVRVLTAFDHSSTPRLYAASNRFFSAQCCACLAAMFLPVALEISQRCFARHMGHFACSPPFSACHVGDDLASAEDFAVAPR